VILAENLLPMVKSDDNARSVPMFEMKFANTLSALADCSRRSPLKDGTVERRRVGYLFKMAVVTR